MKKDLVLFGKIIKPHGVKGEVRVEIKTQPENEILESVYIDIDGKLVPFFVEEFSDKGPFAILKLEGVDTMDDSSRLKSKSCFISALPGAKTNPDPQLTDLLSFVVEDVKAGVIGNVVDIEEGAQSRLVVDKDGQEILIPYADEIIKTIDSQSSKIIVDLPEGFLDIYE